MKKHPAIKRILSLLLALAMVPALLGPAGEGFLPAAHAVTQEEIDSLKGDAEELAKKKKELKAQLATIRNDISKAKTALAILDQQMAVTEQQINNTESQIAGFDTLLNQTAYELAENEKQEAAQYELFCYRARIMEEQGTPSYWAVLFNAADFSDLLSRLTDIQAVLDYDQKVIDDLLDIRARIEEKRAYQEELKTASEDAKAQLEVHKAELDEQIQDSQELVAQLLKDEKTMAVALEAAAEEEERVQKEIVEKTNELARQMGWGASVGGYIWPETTSKRISSPQGPRNTGIPGASTNHKGVDIAGVGYDTEVLAAKAGVVIVSVHSSSYGNYVVISHGLGNTTLYAHMSSRKVKEGDVVTQGQVIGITGSTGISSGPHLHYEITENGKRVNPLDYLPGYIKAW